MEKRETSYEIINEERTEEIKRLLIDRGVDLPESDYQLYGNMFEIIAQLTNNKVDNRTMVDVFDVLSDLIQNKIPSFSAFILKGQEYKTQIRYMSEKNLLQNLTDEEKEAFAFCVWHATRVFTMDDDGEMRSCLIDFDSYDHIKALYDQDRRLKGDSYPTNEKNNTPEAKKKGKYGYCVDNPICTTSIREAYDLIKKVSYYDEPVSISSRYSTSGPNGHMLDVYQLETPSGKSSKIYIDSYSYENSKELPEGFSYKNENKQSPLVTPDALKRVMDNRTVKIEKEEKPMFCRKCGTKLSADSEYCHKCGTKVIRG
jgi:ribosomal protein L40E